MTDASRVDYSNSFDMNAGFSADLSDEDKLPVCDGSMPTKLTEEQLTQQRVVFEAEEIKQKQLLAKLHKALNPKMNMNICLMTVGSWGENVQQFVAIGLRLKADGHRVRIATTSEFRGRVDAAGLEFYPLGGLASSMDIYLDYLTVKRHAKEREKGILDFTKSLVSRKYPEMDDIKALVFSLWPVCVSADPFTPGMTFRADAIIAHPLLFGQTIVAERLGNPLHCMSSTPLTRTQAFPHSRSSSFKDMKLYRYNRANGMSFDAIDHAFVKGMRPVLNEIRSSLGLWGRVGQKNLLTE